MNPETTMIDTLRVRWPVSGPVDPGIGGTVRRQIESADLVPEGLPPASILVVRRVADPLPQRVGTSVLDVRADLVWQRAVRSSLAAMHRLGARPVRGVVTGSPAAVVFEDEAEMIASLAVDMAAGDASHRWWWRSLLGRPRTLSAAQQLYRLWCERAAHVPAAIDHLVRWRRAAPVLALLSARESAAILAATCRAIGAALLAPGDLEATPAAGPRLPGHTDVGFIAGKPLVTAVTADGARRAEPPWAGIPGTDQLPDQATREQVALLGISLAYRRAPARITTDDFRARFQTWWTGEGAGADPAEPSIGMHDLHAAPDPSARSAAQERETEDRPVNARAAARGAQPARGAVVNEPATRATSRNAEATPSPARAARTGPYNPDRIGQGSDQPAASSAAHSPATHMQTDSADARDVFEAPPHADQSAPDEPAVEFDAWTTAGTETSLAGLFYLLNVMRHLGLPGCFETDWRLASKVGVWGTLEVLARALASSKDAPRADTQLAHDPIWAVLAALDRREPGATPAPSLTPPNAYRVPPSWMRAPMVEAATTWCWAAARGRLRVWSRDGFLIADTAGSAAGAQSAALRTLVDYDVQPARSSVTRAPFGAAPIDSMDTPLAGHLGTGLRQWAGFVAPYVRRRLVLAVECEPDDPAALTRTVLAVPGRIYVTSSHVDIVMSLDDASTAIRRAGLDRDPGWSPAAGRVVLFHFR